MTQGELVAHVRHEAESVVRLKGKLEIAMSVRAGDPYKRCKAVLAAQSPWNGNGSAGLYLAGYRQFIPVLFTLVSDGRDFWLHVPHDNIVYTGPVDGPHPVRKGREISLDTGDLFRALFVQPLGTDSVEVATDSDEYKVSLRAAGRLERCLWVERRQFTVRREVYYGPAGEPRLEIERDVPARGTVSYPARIALRDVPSGSAILLESGSLTINPEKLAAELFRPRLPAGVIVDRTDRPGGRT